MTDQLTKIAEEFTEKIWREDNDVIGPATIKRNIKKALLRAVELERERLKPWLYHKPGCETVTGGHHGTELIGCTCELKDTLDELQKGQQ